MDPLPGEPPGWCRSLPWNVQLALAVIEQQKAGDASAWSPLLRSWPANAPPLPKNLDAANLATVQDQVGFTRTPIKQRATMPSQVV